MEAAWNDSFENEAHGVVLDRWYRGAPHLQSSDSAIVNLFFSSRVGGGGGSKEGSFQGNKTNQDFTIKANISN